MGQREADAGLRAAKVKVLIVCQKEEEVGGVQNVIVNLTRHLRTRGHEVSHFHIGTNALMRSTRNSQGIPCYDLHLQLPLGDRPWIASIPLFLVRFPMALAQLIRLIRKNGIQVVNVQYPGESACYFAILRRLLPIGLVTSVHGADLFPGGKPLAHYSRAFRLLLDSSDRITTPSRSFRNDVVREFPHLEKKVTPIHNGVHFEEMASPAADADTTKLDHFLLCVAMHNEKKGLDVLLQAFARIEKDDPLLKLALVGDGPLRGELEAMARALGIADRVHFLGRKGRPQVADLLWRCEIFVLPSRAEPFGIVLIEAMACRKPVVATTVGGIPEIIEDGRNGLLVEPDNPAALASALVRVLKNRDLQSELVCNGFATVHEKFSSEAMGDRYAAVFETVLGK